MDYLVFSLFCIHCVKRGCDIRISFYHLMTAFVWDHRILQDTLRWLSETRHNGMLFIELDAMGIVSIVEVQVIVLTSLVFFGVTPYVPLAQFVRKLWALPTLTMSWALHHLHYSLLFGWSFVRRFLLFFLPWFECVMLHGWIYGHQWWVIPYVILALWLLNANEETYGDNWLWDAWCSPLPTHSWQVDDLMILVFLFLLNW